MHHNDADIADIRAGGARFDQSASPLKKCIGVIAPKVIPNIQLKLCGLMMHVSVQNRSCGVGRPILAIGATRQKAKPAPLFCGQFFGKQTLIGCQNKLLIASSLSAYVGWCQRDRGFAAGNQAVRAMCISEVPMTK